ncbi:MAG: tetratricopeptide repeat protein, partial [Chloroflexia bacterium]
LAARAAACVRDQTTSEWALGELIKLSADRLDMVRIMMPYDLDLARLAAGRYPEMAVTHAWLGDALRLGGDNEGAIREYEHSLELDPSEADTWFLLGRLYEEHRQDLEAAAKAYDQACFLVDHGKNGCLAAHAVYLKLGLDDLAAERYASYLKQVGLPADTPR